MFTLYIGPKIDSPSGNWQLPREVFAARPEFEQELSHLKQVVRELDGTVGKPEARYGGLLRVNLPTEEAREEIEKRCPTFSVMAVENFRVTSQEVLNNLDLASARKRFDETDRARILTAIQEYGGFVDHAAWHFGVPGKKDRENPFIDARMSRPAAEALARQSGWGVYDPIKEVWLNPESASQDHQYDQITRAVAMLEADCKVPPVSNPELLEKLGIRRRTIEVATEGRTHRQVAERLAEIAQTAREICDVLDDGSGYDLYGDPARDRNSIIVRASHEEYLDLSERKLGAIFDHSAGTDAEIRQAQQMRQKLFIEAQEFIGKYLGTAREDAVPSLKKKLIP